MCEVILVVLHCIILKLLNIFPIKNSKELCKIIFFQTKCCSTTMRRSLMCEVILVVLHCIILKLLNIFLFSALHFVDGP